MYIYIYINIYIDICIYIWCYCYCLLPKNCYRYIIAPLYEKAGILKKPSQRS